MPKLDKPGIWRQLFLWLCGVNALIIIVIVALLFWPVSETDTPEPTKEDTKPSSEFIVRTSKQNLNELVNAYIDKLLKGSNHHYQVTLKDNVKLVGELPAFSSSVRVSLQLDPVVQNNGDVILKQKSISIGQLQLPNKKIMEYLKKYLPMPKWVTVDPANEEIYVAVTDMTIRSNFRISVEQFDLKANNLAFKINVPYESLGIEMDIE
ncbi:YpmS family protein [Lentibacillus halophilus]|uniref:YpmS family protein n=1 Tax=Lentibacillus halophilus TaxID=295065 RepID=A0ABN0Z6C2_9BACI